MFFHGGLGLSKVSLLIHSDAPFCHLSLSLSHTHTLYILLSLHLLCISHSQKQPLNCYTTYLHRYTPSPLPSIMPPSKTHTVTRHRTRRFYACHRHPNIPVTGFCALCLQDRLASLDSSSGQLASSPATVPEFRRSKSVAVERCKDVGLDPRRKSCDVRARNTLSDLFVVDDKRKLGFSTKESVEEEEGIDDHEIWVSDDDDEVIEGDLKTMKEIIDMEFNNNNNNNNNKRNLLSAASVFSQKLRKWREKKQKRSRGVKNGGNVSTENDRLNLGQLSQFRDAESEAGDYGFGRRSCDTEPRFSIDAHRLSVEDQPRFSLDERRASWDGYMMARTIPRLTPMLSVVDNMILGPVNRVANSTVENLNLQMHSISEDGVSSGGSAQSNSDCSSSNRGSSSSSMKSFSTKTAGFGGDDVKSASNARVSPASDVVFQGTKLVITEKELKDWHLNSIKNNHKNVESASNASNSTSKTSVMNITNPSKEMKKKVMSSRWRKVCNLWGHKHKLDDRNGENKNLEHIPVSRVEIENSSTKLVRNPGSVNSRTRRVEFLLDRNRSTRYSTSDIDSGLLRLYLTPFRNSRRNKFGRSRAPPSMITNGMQLH